MVRSQYVYQGLPTHGTIRLLRLTKGKTKPASGTLLTTTLDDAPAYHALSYAWGTSKRDARILLDGITFYVTPSLAAALEEFAVCEARPRDTDIEVDIQYLWIDQICTNQDDLAERAAQVRQMGKIYGKSQRTIAWLGVDWGTAAQAVLVLEKLRKLHGEHYTRADGSWDEGIFDEGTVNWDLHKSLGLPAVHDIRWKAMIKFLASSWFRRVWIVQEIVLSPTDPVIFCGDVRCSWNMVALAGFWLYLRNYTYGHVPQSVQCLNYLKYMRQSNMLNTSYSLDGLVYFAQSYLCTDPRDNIYGVLALLEPVLTKMTSKASEPASGVQPISADYTISVSAAHQKAMQSVIESTGNMGFLSLPLSRLPGSWDLFRCFGRQAFWKHRPSWLPHFEDVPRPRHFMTCKDPEPGSSYESSLQFYFDASGGRPANADIVGPVLRAEGVRTDKATSCFPTCTWDVLAQQNGQSDKLKLSSLIDQIRFRREQRRHQGQFRGAAFVLYNCVAGRKRPVLLRIWETVLESKDCLVALSSPVTGTPSSAAPPRSVLLEAVTEALHAVLMATTTGADANYTIWDPVDKGVIGLRGLLLDLYDRWPPRRPKCEAAARVLRDSYIAAGVQRLSTLEIQYKKSYATAMQYWCALRRVFVTEKGYVGVGPSSMAPGDVVGVLFGSAASVVLRPRDKYWLLVGDCYIDKWSNGEVMDALARRELREEYFEIH